MDNNQPEQPALAPPARETNQFLEAAIIRDYKRDLSVPPEIYLWQLPAHAPFFPGLWTVPRFRYRHGETDEDVIIRAQKELGSTIEKYSPRIDLFKFHELPTETYFSFTFIVQLGQDPPVDQQRKWFRVDQLPPTISNFHRDKIIPPAVKYYMHNTTK